MNNEIDDKYLPSAPAPARARRSIVKGAAWSLPVISLAIAAPAASASEAPPKPVFHDWSVGGSASVGSGNNAFFTINGQALDGESASLPVGFTFTITPPPEVSLVVNSSPGFLDTTVNPDGSITGTVIPDYPGVPRINFKVTGPVGAVIVMVGNGPYEPYVDSKNLTIRTS